MSSKLLRKNFTAGAAAMEWISRDTLPGIPAPRRTDPRPASGQKEAEPEPEFRQLQLRLEEMEVQVERRSSEARYAGYHEGELAGREAARAEIQPLLERMAAAIHELADLRPRLREQAEGDLVSLAVAIARRILHRELHTDSEAIAGLVRVALEKLRLQEVTRVRVHPDQRVPLQRLLAELPRGAHVEVASDPTQERGSVVFETSRGNLDVSVETQLREIDRGLTDRIRGKSD